LELIFTEDAPLDYSIMMLKTLKRDPEPAPYSILHEGLTETSIELDSLEHGYDYSFLVYGRFMRDGEERMHTIARPANYTIQ
jgi:hypothetical protein